MRLETLRLLKAWLSHATYGVNAQIAGVPRSGGDAQPAGFALIAEATTHDLAARGQLPDVAAQYPCLLLGLGQSTMLDPHSAVGLRRGVVVVGLRYADKDSNTQRGMRNAEYRLRAIARSIDDWFVNGAPADREQNSVTVHYIERGIEVVEPFAPVADSVVAGLLTVAFQVRDDAP